MQSPGRGEIGSDKPVAVAVFERLRHLGGDEQQRRGDRHEGQCRRNGAHQRQRPTAEPAEREHLHEVDQAQGGDEEKAQCEQPRIDREQGLVHGDGDGKNREGAQSQSGFEQGARITDAHVCLVAPFLASLDDMVLRGPHEGPARAERGQQRNDHVEGHPRTDHLAEQGWHARPPRPPAARLRDDEAEPRRDRYPETQQQRVAELPGDVVPADCQQQGRIADELDQHQRTHPVREQVDRRLDLGRQAVATPPDGPQQPERALEASCRPSRLLAPVGVDRDRELLGHDQVFEVRGPPASQLRPVAEVEVFGQGVGGPAPRVHDRHPAPDAGRACEVDEVSGGGPHGLFDEEVEIDEQRLQAGEPRIALVEVSPARLHKTDRRVLE